MLLGRISFFSRKFLIGLFLLFMVDAAISEPDQEIICPKNPPVVPEVSRNSVYDKTPYKQGEKSVYEVRYMGALAGIGTLEVKRPFKYEGPFSKPIWHRNFHAEAKTGDWYKLIFVARDRIDAYVRPWDHGVTRFFIEQDEGKLFGSRLVQKKWLEFNHEKCTVLEKTEKPELPQENVEYALSFGAMDTLGIVYWLREQKFEIGKKVRGLTYSSEKNWWLEAEPLKFEELQVGAGKFNTVKINLQTYIGKELQQKGDVNVWFATDTPERQLVQIKGEIKIGSVWMELVEFTAGK